MLDLPYRQALDAEDFMVSRSNEAALALVEAWPTWPTSAIIVTGPSGSGKSHLVNVWRTRSAADVVCAGRLSEDAVRRFASSAALAVEDLDQGIADERVLFHLLNLAREHKLSLLLTARRAPGEFDMLLPDLRSRVRALPHAPIAPPDQCVIGALLVKLFADRQIRIEPHVVAYIARHIDRSAEAAQRIVALVDERALATRRRVSRVLVGEVLRELECDVGNDEGDH